MKKIKKNRERYPKKVWLRMMGSKKLNKVTRALWNTCMKKKTDQTSAFVTAFIAGPRELPVEVNTEVNTLELVVQKCGTRKSYSEYEELKAQVAMATKTNWQQKFNEAKAKT